MRVAFVKNKNRNDSISIGASVIMDELAQRGIDVAICDYETAFDYDVVLVSMTCTEDIFDLYANMRAHDWEHRTFKAMVGGFGCQNPIALSDFVDYAFFGRADGIICEVITHLFANPTILDTLPYMMNMKCPKQVKIRQVNTLYSRPVKYGKNCTTWHEKFIGCVFNCAFCHYSWSRERIGGDTYINNGLSTGSPEILMRDIPEYTEKLGRFTTALDGYSERLRYLFGKRISWDMVEVGLDHIASFRGNTYMKLYNIHNFPTETEQDREEFFTFFGNYAQNSMKPDGVLSVEVLNTAFRPSLNTPMRRMEATLYPPARYEDSRVAGGDGFSFRMSINNRDAYSHLHDMISIRYTDRDIIHYIATDKQFRRMNNAEKMIALTTKYDITPYIRRYELEEALPFNYILSENQLKSVEKRLYNKISTIFVTERLSQ